jgi:glycerol-3-phosphate dehydrogenase (NAD(P)+)
MRVAVLGGGAWGGVLAWQAAGRGHEVALWEIDPDVAMELARRRSTARSVARFRLPDAVTVSSDMATSVAGSDMVVLAVPSAFAATVLRTAAPYLPPAPLLVCASKGLDPATGATMAEVMAAGVPGARTAVLSGPSFAQEISDGQPTALVAAASDDGVAQIVQTALGSERLRIYTSDDVPGVCVGGALKNVIAIAVGCCDGFRLGDNARAALITRGLAEMGRLAERLGGRAITLAGMAGLGDLVLTCTGELSRNRQVGLALARGESLADILSRLGHVAEGVATSETASRLAAELGVDMPITREVAAVLHQHKAPRAAVIDLLARSIGAER